VRVALPRLLSSAPAVAIPPERLIAFGRLFLAIFACAAIYAEPPGTSKSAQLAVTGTYIAFALVCVAFVMKRHLTVREQVYSHAADMLCVSIIMYLTEGPSSPFFVFFTFILLAGTLRWNWQGALVTALLLALTFAVLVVLIGAQSLASEIGELSRAIIRTGYILVAGAMLSYVGAFQERSRERLSKLAAWPGPDPARLGEAPIGASLAHAAKIMDMPRVLIIWEQPAEPFRHVALWSPAGIEFSRERVDRFGTLVAPALVEASFEVCPKGAMLRGDDRLGLATSQTIDADLIRCFSVTYALTSPFNLPACAGRVFLLDRRGSNHDDLVMSCLVAMRLGVDIEHHLLRQELETTAALKERSRLANDLHDGVLQGLAAANIQLKLTTAGSSDDIAGQLAQTRHLLAAEQQRVRSFVESSRSQTRHPSGATVYLRDELAKRLQDLRIQWACRIDLKIDPPDLVSSPETAHHVRHFLAEAVSNAARHGTATAVEIGVTAVGNRLRLRVTDNGTGFPALRGTFSGTELMKRNVGPASLLNRVEELGGTLMLRTSSSGSDIQVEVPHAR
jgi:signal transduction histidine kinase